MALCTLLISYIYRLTEKKEKGEKKGEEKRERAIKQRQAIQRQEKRPVYLYTSN
jgi:hypothetical protein